MPACPHISRWIAVISCAYGRASVTESWVDTCGWLISQPLVRIPGRRRRSCLGEHRVGHTVAVLMATGGWGGPDGDRRRRRRLHQALHGRSGKPFASSDGIHRLMRFVCKLPLGANWAMLGSPREPGSPGRADCLASGRRDHYRGPGCQEQHEARAHCAGRRRSTREPGSPGRADCAASGPRDHHQCDPAAAIRAREIHVSRRLPRPSGHCCRAAPRRPPTIRRCCAGMSIFCSGRWVRNSRATPLMASRSPSGRRFPPQDLVPPSCSKALPFPPVVDPAAPPLRTERHIRYDAEAAAGGQDGVAQTNA
jgi:hypothetical protein